jgi:hypothetical protein
MERTGFWKCLLGREGGISGIKMGIPLATFKLLRILAVSLEI